MKRNGRNISSDLRAETDGCEKNGRKWKKDEQQQQEWYIPKNPSLDCRGRLVSIPGVKSEKLFINTVLKS